VTADGAARPRTRDPARKERILLAAADLIALKGYHTVSIMDLGAAAESRAPAIYRHFGSKSAVLVELFDRVIDALLRDAQETVLNQGDLQKALTHLIAGQVEFVVANRALAQVYHLEVNNLPHEDRRRLRRKQRLYVEEWVHLVAELRSNLTDAEARAVVHAAIAAIQSALFHSVGLTEDQLRRLLTESAAAVLGVD
jgi:AcrR family transcriptional regulator